MKSLPCKKVSNLPCSGLEKVTIRKDDPFFVQKSILKSLLADVSRFLPGTKGLDRDYVTLEARLEHEGISFLPTALSALGKSLDQGLSEGRFTMPFGWKHAKGKKIPLFLGGVFSKVFDDKTGDLKGEDCTLEVSLLRQFLYFLEEVDTCYWSRRKA
jgi:hypothetical protein